MIESDDHRTVANWEQDASCNIFILAIMLLYWEYQLQYTIIQYAKCSFYIISSCIIYMFTIHTGRRIWKAWLGGVLRWRRGPPINQRPERKFNSCSNQTIGVVLFNWNTISFSVASDFMIFKILWQTSTTKMKKHLKTSATRMNIKSININKIKYV